MTLGGFICIRNGDRLDYCWREAAMSLLPVCDKVVICDCDSDDGTREVIDAWVAREPKLIPLNFPWTNPQGDPWWWPTWLNTARQHLPTDYCIYLDADEVLHEDHYGKVLDIVALGKVAMIKRLNFWKDHKHLVPEGHCLGFEVIRIGPRHLAFPSDYPWPPHTTEIEGLAERHHEIQIFHYGHIRPKKEFFLKAREVSRIWSGGEFDPRLANAETFDGNWAEDHRVAEWVDKLVPLPEGICHPKIAIPWLRERGFAVDDEGKPI